MVGKASAIELLLVALLCEGHALLEDVPGVGKTLLSKALARSLGCTFRRIQCTPDLLPSDITGVAVFDQRSQDFTFRPGPIFTQLLLVDEINRATPRTQAALLEAMEERQVTAEGETRPLTRPFLVLATQNPIDMEGTYPLPEAQLDRFLLRIHLGYPDEAEELAIIQRFRGRDPLGEIQPVLQPDQVLRFAAAAWEVHLAEDTAEYAIRLVRATRTHGAVTIGASPRATLALTRAARALALLRGRDFVIPDDIKELAPAVLAHRLVLAPDAEVRGARAENVIDACVDATPVPVESWKDGREAPRDLA